MSHLSEDEAAVVGRSLIAIADIGSNGIRFSISSKASHHARIMPCVFKDRLNISLFDVQYKNSASTKNPIPQETINEICQGFKRFKLICEDFGVNLEHGVKIIATEATREATNSKEFIKAIFDTTGWTVDLLSKEQEGIIGAYGVASSFNTLSGLFIDLGGGSSQISWIVSGHGSIKMSETPVSFPYGAAALTRRLKIEDRKVIYNEIRENYARAIEKINIPPELYEQAKRNGGFDIYTCGGGLRGFGHLLLNQDQSYPLSSIINGYTVTFDDASEMANYLVLKRDLPTAEDIFRVSKKRRIQLPAVGFLLSAMFESLPKIKTIQFSEGGVREGVLYSQLSRSVISQDPLITATKPYQPLLADRYLNLLKSALPVSTVPKEILSSVAPALCNIAFVHCSYPKELQPSAALHVATSGILAGSHGLSHRTRALIGIAYCERWGGDLSKLEESFKQSLETAVLKSGPRKEMEKILFWCKFIGRVMYVLCGVHPGGNIRDSALKFQVTEKSDITSEDADELSNEVITTRLSDETYDEDMTETGAVVKRAKTEKEREKTKRRFEVIVKLNPNDIKVGSSVQGRVLNLQKKIKKLNKSVTFGEKCHIEIQYVNN